MDGPFYRRWWCCGSTERLFGTGLSRDKTHWFMGTTKMNWRLSQVEIWKGRRSDSGLPTRLSLLRLRPTRVAERSIRCTTVLCLSAAWFQWSTYFSEKLSSAVLVQVC